MKSPFERAILLMTLGNVLVVVWLRPELKGAAATARAEDAPAWAVILLILSLGLLAYCAVEVYLIHVFREKPPADD